MSNSTPRPVRYVVFHSPGPVWKHGVDFREQDGVREHVPHYLKFHEAGKLELGGPFLLQDAGGMMVATKDVSHDELEAFAAADPDGNAIELMEYGPASLQLMGNTSNLASR